MPGCQINGPILSFYENPRQSANDAVITMPFLREAISGMRSLAFLVPRHLMLLFLFFIKQHEREPEISFSSCIRWPPIAVPQQDAPKSQRFGFSWQSGAEVFTGLENS
jgi:hypothetical protein